MKRTNMVWLLAVILVVTMGVTSAYAGNKVEKVRHSLKALDLANTPSVRELMAAGQLGGQLFPTREIRKNKKQRRHHREFGRAIDRWNRHEYKTAVKLFREYARKYPDSPWADEALLHVGCDARYNGRYDEAEANFRSIIDKNEKSAYEGAQHLATKARTRLGVLKVLQNDFAEAKAHFRHIKQSGSTWRERTYASYWLQRISLYEGDQKAMLKCGVQALAAIMEKEGKKTAARQVAQVRPQSLKGHSLLSLKKIASSHGYALDARRLKAEGLKKVDLPAIVQINGKSSDATGHYWVLEKIKTGVLTLFDPQSGRRFTQTLKEFEAQWEGIILLKQKSKKRLPGTPLSAADMADLFGGCCGARRGEGGLGGPGGNGAGGGGGCNGSGCCGGGGCSGGSGGGSGGGNGPFGNPVWKVNMINMNLYVHDVPMWYRPPIGPEVRIGLSYNSLATTAYHEPFGNKWQFSYSTYLVVDTGGNVTIFMPDGRRDIYVPDGSGGYTQPYGVRNRLTKIAENHFELRFPDDTVFIYNIPAGTGSLQPFLVEIRDVHNLSLAFGYNADAELTTITDAQGRVTQLTYNTQGLVSQVADPFGRTASFEYDAGRNLTRITDMGGYWFNFSYDQDVYLTGIENQRGVTQFWIEPADGVPANSDNYPPPGDNMWENYRITVTYPEGEKEEYMYYGGCDAYNGFGCSGYSWHVKPSHYIPWQSQQINNYRVDTPKTYYRPVRTDNGQRAEVFKIIYPDGTYTQYGIDTATGERISSSDNSGDGVSYTFNNMGQVTSITDVHGNVTNYTYAANGVDLINIQDDLGTITKTYNDRHQITSMTDRMGHTYSYSYNDLGLITSETNSLGIVDNYIYDTSYHLIEVQRDGKTLYEFVRDNIGRVISKTDANGLTLQYTYSDLNQFESITYPDNKKVSYQLCDCCPWLISSMTDRGGHTTTYQFDSLNYKTIEIRPDGSAIRYIYDKNHNLIEIKDPNGNSTRLEYDANDRLTKRIYADGGVIAYNYDSYGRLRSRTNARGIQAIYSYNSYDNLVNISYSDDTPSVTYAYDNYNRIIQAQNGIGTYRYTYNANSRIVEVDGPWDNDTVSYQYDNRGRIINVIPELGQAIAYQYDSLNREEKITAGPKIFGFIYPAGASNLAQILTRPNGSKTAYQYDNINHLVTILNKNSEDILINRYDYMYNSQDWRGSETITNGEPMMDLQQGVTGYQYNSLNQLTSTIDPDQTFEYDADGNMVKGVTPEGFEFTATYDAEDRLESVSYSDSSATLHVTEFKYNIDNFLGVIKQYTDGTLIGETRIVRDGFLALQERNKDNQVTREYVWGLNINGGIGGLLSMAKDGESFNYLYDGKGNVVTLLDTSQQVVASYKYDDFGNLLSEAGTLEQPFMFSTKRFFKDIGLYYYGYRFYAPSIGRWISRDPIGERGGINLYGFVQNNPINMIDPYGLNFLSWLCGCDDDDDDECEEQAQRDEEICRKLPPGSPQRARCWASANERYGACRAGRPLPPLVTW